MLLAALDILGVGDAASTDAARHLGIAWALIGLLRAVPFHARQRRLYLPVDLLMQTGVDPDALIEGRPQAGLADVAAKIVARVRDRLHRARDRQQRVARAALPVMLLAVLAERHCRRLERRQFQLFTVVPERPAPFDTVRLALAAWRQRI